MTGFLNVRRGLAGSDIIPLLPCLAGLCVGALIALTAVVGGYGSREQVNGSGIRPVTPLAVVESRGEGLLCSGTPLPVAGEAATAQQAHEPWWSDPRFDLTLDIATLLAFLLYFGLMRHRLRQSKLGQQQLRRYLDSAMDLLCVVGPDGRLEWLSPSWRSTLGWTEAELSAKPYLDFVHPDDVEHAHRQAQALRRGEPVRCWENRCRHRDGSYRWLQWNATPQSDGTVYAVVREITDSRRAAEALAESERRFRDMIEGSVQAIIIHRQCVALFANSAFAELFGFASAEEVMALPGIGMLLPGRGAPSPCQAGRYEGPDGRPALRRRVRVQRRDGTEIWVECIERTVDWQGQEAVQFTMTDVTDQKRAEDALRDREAMLRRGVDLAKLGYWVHDRREGRIVQCSEELAEIHGVTVNQFLAEYATIDRYVAKCHPEDQDRYDRVIRFAIERGTAYDLEYRTINPDGTARHIREIGEPVFDEAGQVLRYIGTQQNITDVKRREVELLEAQSRLERLAADLAALAQSRDRARRAAEEALNAAETANRAKTQFLATMSHELRTPLNAILGFAEIIRDRAFGDHDIERYADYAGDIYSSGRHLLDLINDILDISKVEAGKLQIEPVWLELRQMLRASTRLVQERAEKNGLSLTVDIEDGLTPLWADQRAVKQILFNLLSNSIKFTPRGGRITIHAFRAGRGDVALAVSDTGIGIPADQIPRVLRPFEQLDNRYSRANGGTGLGLALVRALAEVHGAIVQVDSAVGVGTTVTVRFPAARMPQMRALAG